MSSVQHLAVSPKLPTTLADQTHLDLPGYDIILCYVSSVYIVPTKLDVSRFEEALSRILQLYPHAAGKLRYIDRRWVIELTNSAIPLLIEYKLNSSSDSLLPNDDRVTPNDLSPFLDIQPIAASVFNDSAPLVSVKLTFFDNETCIGVTWQHSLGDGTVRFRFLHTLSQFYQGLSPEFSAPSFKKYHFPTPSDAVVAEIWPRIPHLHETCDLEAFPTSLASCELVRWRISDRDIGELHSTLSSKQQNGPSLSKQDCISAYLVAVFNDIRNNPVKRVTNTVRFHQVKAPFITENVASNLIMDVAANVPVDMVGIATVIRNSLIQYREPNYIYRWMSVTNHLKFEAFNAHKAFPFPGDDDELIINSLRAVDWCSVHFGCPDGTQFYTEGPFKGCARVTRSNPVKGVDGVWRARQSVDVSMGVAPELKHKLLETLARGVRYMLDSEDQL